MKGCVKGQIVVLEKNRRTNGLLQEMVTYSMLEMTTAINQKLQV